MGCEEGWKISGCREGCVIEGTALPCIDTLTWCPPRLQLILKCCVYTACFATALVYTNWSLAALLLLLCLPAAANFYIVVSQNVVTVAVVLEMQAHVGRDQHLCCLLFPLRH